MPLLKSASLPGWQLRLVHLPIDREWAKETRASGHIVIRHSQGSDIFSPYERITVDGQVIYEPPDKYQRGGKSNS